MVLSHQNWSAEGEPRRATESEPKLSFGCGEPVDVGYTFETSFDQSVLQCLKIFRS